jgi:aryl-alcohol dehydrogenase-like predicted oxidoreductase
VAATKGATAAQFAVAWVLAKGAAIVPILGARIRAQLADLLGALPLSSTPAAALTHLGQARSWEASSRARLASAFASRSGLNSKMTDSSVRPSFST